MDLDGYLFSLAGETTLTTLKEWQQVFKLPQLR